MLSRVRCVGTIAARWASNHDPVPTTSGPAAQQSVHQPRPPDEVLAVGHEAHLRTYVLLQQDPVGFDNDLLEPFKPLPMRRFL
jgi:hypothetical protein